MPFRDPLAKPEPLVRKVYAYVAYRIGAGPDAEDLVNDVFERALRYRDSYDAAKGDPATWLVGIARRCIADRYRGDQDPPAVALPEQADEMEERTLQRLRVRAAVAGLDDRDRELIALRYGADLTASRIGELLDLSTNAVEVALHRALARLRPLLDEDASEPVAGDTEPARI